MAKKPPSVSPKPDTSVSAAAPATGLDDVPKTEPKVVKVVKKVVVKKVVSPAEPQVTTPATANENESGNAPASTVKEKISTTESSSNLAPVKKAPSLLTVPGPSSDASSGTLSRSRNSSQTRSPSQVN